LIVDPVCVVKFHEQFSSDLRVSIYSFIKCPLPMP
jgi:hypothetical protein